MITKRSDINPNPFLYFFAALGTSCPNGRIYILLNYTGAGILSATSVDNFVLVPVRTRYHMFFSQSFPVFFSSGFFLWFNQKGTVPNIFYFFINPYFSDTEESGLYACERD
jgi:hypothetical protein